LEAHKILNTTFNIQFKYWNCLKKFRRQFELESLKCKFSKKKVFGDGQKSDVVDEMEVGGKRWKDKGNNKKKSFFELFTKCKLTPDLWKFTPGIQASLANDNGSSAK
jgi:hypothetical protein